MRRIFVLRDGKAVPKHSAPPLGGVFRSCRSHLPSPYLMGDISEFISPIDYTPITSRSQLRDHERKHGVRQCGELKTAADYDNSVDITSALDGESLSKIDEAAPFSWGDLKD